jgi:hypothetical protein
MWPALRPGDLLLGHPIGSGEQPAVGTVLVAHGAHGLIAHRLLRLSGQEVILAGDLTGPDSPFARSDIRGVATRLYRRGAGFRSIPKPLAIGPLSRRILQRCLAPLARVSALGPENLLDLALDEPAIRRLLEEQGERFVP